MAMEFSKIIISLSALLLVSSADETFTNSDQLCQTCECEQTQDNFILNCQNASFEHMIANWPVHSTRLTATFSFNEIPHLELLPASDLVLEIILSHCHIESIDPGAFKAVKFLRLLDLSYNQLTTEEISPEIFKGPYNNSDYEPLALEDLNLAYNKIHSLPHKLFEHVQLKQLNLAGNDFRVLDNPTQQALEGLTELEVLNLAGNELTELVEDAIRSLQKLRILDLSNNMLDFVPKTLTLLSSSLEAVYLDKNPIFEITDGSFLGVKGIRALSLTNLPRLQYVNAYAFRPIQNLSVLYLSDNPNLTTIDRDAFGTELALEELYIHNNSLDDLHYNLTNWSTLKLFSFKGNNFFCDCDLYKISKDLRAEIKRDKDGPICINPVNDTSMMVYDLTEEACGFQVDVFRLSHVIEHHFKTMKLVFVLLIAVAVLTAMVTILIAFLRYRRHRMNQNYPFVTRVSYNPLRGPNIN